MSPNLALFLCLSNPSGADACRFRHPGRWTNILNSLSPVSPSIFSSPFFIGTISQVQVDVWQVPGTFALPKKKKTLNHVGKSPRRWLLAVRLAAPGPFSVLRPPGTTETARKPHCDVARQATSLASPAAWPSPSPSLFSPPVAVCRDVRPVSLRPLPLAEQRC